jgi:hypothetical protein
VSLTKLEFLILNQKKLKSGGLLFIMSDLDVLGVLAAAPIQPEQLKRRANEEVARIPVFNVKKVDPLAQNLGFVIRLDS